MAQFSAGSDGARSQGPAARRDGRRAGLGEGDQAGLAARLPPAVSGAQDAQHSVQAAADDAAKDESAGAPSVPRAELRRRAEAWPRPYCPVQRSLHSGDGVPGTGPRRMCHPFALSRGPSSADSHDESLGTAERRKSASDQSDSALSYGALVPHAALRQFADRVQALARYSDDGVVPSPTSTASVGHDSDQKGGRSRRVTTRGGFQRLNPFTGNLGLDLDAGSKLPATLNQRLPGGAR